MGILQRPRIATVRVAGMVESTFGWCSSRRYVIEFPRPLAGCRPLTLTNLPRRPPCLVGYADEPLRGVLPRVTKITILYCDLFFSRSQCSIFNTRPIRSARQRAPP
jgi:hypothetical protein